MQILLPSAPGYRVQLARFSRRAAPTPQVESVVTEVMQAVRERGDDALLELIARFDKGATLATRQPGMSLQTWARTPIVDFGWV